MEIIHKTWMFLNTNSGVLGLFLALVPIVWSSLLFLHLKRQEIKQKQFENYHKLIKELVEGINPNTYLYIDRQIAVVFELRRFKNYYPVTKRILSGLKVSWSNNLNASRLIQEIDFTLNSIK